MTPPASGTHRDLAEFTRRYGDALTAQANQNLTKINQLLDAQRANAENLENLMREQERQISQAIQNNDTATADRLRAEQLKTNEETQKWYEAIRESEAAKAKFEQDLASAQNTARQGTDALARLNQADQQGCGGGGCGKGGGGGGGSGKGGGGGGAGVLAALAIGGAVAGLAVAMASGGSKDDGGAAQRAAAAEQKTRDDSLKAAEEEANKVAAKDAELREEAAKQSGDPKNHADITALLNNLYKDVKPTEPTKAFVPHPVLAQNQFGQPPPQVGVVDLRVTQCFRMPGRVVVQCRTGLAQVCANAAGQPLPCP